MWKSIMKWLKKHATIAKIGALLVFLGVFEEFVRGIQKDLDEVRYSREIIQLEKNHIKEIDDYKMKIYTLRDENLNLRLKQFGPEEIEVGKKRHIIEKEVNDESK